MQLEWALCTEERVFVAHSSVFRLEFNDKRPSQGSLGMRTLNRNAERTKGMLRNLFLGMPA